MFVLVIIVVCCWFLVISILVMYVGIYEIIFFAKTTETSVPLAAPKSPCFLRKGIFQKGQSPGFYETIFVFKIQDVVTLPNANAVRFAAAHTFGSVTWYVRLVSSHPSYFSF